MSVSDADPENRRIQINGENAPLLDSLVQISEEESVSHAPAFWKSLWENTWFKLAFKFFALTIGPLLAIPFMFDILYPGHISISRCVAVVIITSSWWILEPIPLAVASLAPFLLFPAFGVTGAADIATAYFNDQIFIFITSYIIAIGIEECNLHKRFALTILYMTFGIPILILGGFMFIAFFLSMWLNNTSTAAMLLPMANAIILDLKEKEDLPGFYKALMLAIPYCASIGGISTLTGTGTNLVFTFQLHEVYPKFGSFSFLSWLSFCTPMAFIFLVIAWIYFVIVFIRNWKLKTEISYFKAERDKLGSIKYDEWIMIGCFILVCVLWITRELPFGKHVGWGYLFKDKFMTDASASTFVSILLFIIPSRSRPGHAILDWKKVVVKIPWSIVLLLGAGFSLARGFERAGFSQFVAYTIRRIGTLPIFFILFLICLFLSFATEFMSNVVCASIAVPILGRLAPEISQNPLFFMIPATIVCSFAFMSPIGTPPNSIAFGYGYVKMWDMIKTGFLLNLIGMCLLIGWMYLASPLIGIEQGKVPHWALNTTLGFDWGI